MSTKKEERFKKRKLIVQAYLESKDMVDVKAQFNISSTELIDLTTRYRDGGWEALKDGYRMVTPNSIHKSTMETIIKGTSSQFEISKEGTEEAKVILAEMTKRKNKK